MEIEWDRVWNMVCFVYVLAIICIVTGARLVPETLQELKNLNAVSQEFSSHLTWAAPVASSPRDNLQEGSPTEPYFPIPQEKLEVCIFT